MAKLSVRDVEVNGRRALVRVDFNVPLDGQRIMMGQGSKRWGMISPRESAMATMGVFVYLEDVDKHHAQACAAGAEIVQAPGGRAKARAAMWGDQQSVIR